MGFWGLFRKGNQKRNIKVKVEFSTHEPTIKEMKEQWKIQTAEKIKNFQKDEAGLYPYEILMLSYLEKYADGGEPAKFWEREYGIDDVNALISSLEKRGFAEKGVLTELGKAEIQKNEYVLYMHRHKFSDVSMSRMSILVNQHTDIPYRDLLWGEFNRMLGEHTQNGQFGLYRNTIYTMYRFLLEEKRYYAAFPFISETFFYDLNGSDSPFIAPALIKDIRLLEQKIDYAAEKMINILQDLFSGMYAPYNNYENDEVIGIIISYAFGDDEMAEKIFNKK